MTAALKIITASLCLILISLSLRACAPPPDPRRSREFEQKSDEESDPRQEILHELHALRDEMQLNHADIIFTTIDIEESLLHDMDPLIVPHFLKTLAPNARTPSLRQNWEIGYKWLDPPEHETCELISGSGRPRELHLTNNLIMDK